MNRIITVIVSVAVAATFGALAGLQTGAAHRQKFSLLPAVVQEVPRGDKSFKMRAVVHASAVNDTAEIRVADNARKGDVVEVWVQKSTRRIVDEGIPSPGENAFFVASLSGFGVFAAALAVFAAIDYRRRWGSWW